MVAECCIPNPESKPFVDHINEDNGDNIAESLGWATNGDNQRNIRSNRNENSSGVKGIQAGVSRGKCLVNTILCW